MFPEKTEVGFVGGSPAEEEEFVLRDDGCAKFAGGFALKLVSSGKGESESLNKFWSNGLVAVFGEMKSVVGEAGAVADRGEEIGKVEVVFFCHFKEGFGIAGQPLVVFRHVGHGGSEALGGRRGNDDNLAGLCGGLDHIEKPFVTGDEFREPFLTFKGGAGTVANDDYVWLQLAKVGFEAVKAFFRWSEVAAGVPEDGVATPTEIAEFEILFFRSQREGCFKMAILLGTFDDGVSEEGDHVIVFEGDRCDGDDCEEQEKEPGLHDNL